MSLARVQHLAAAGGRGKRFAALVGCMSAMAVFFVAVAPAMAKVKAPPYVAVESGTTNKKFVLEPGASATFSIKYKNTGSQPWLADGKKFVSVYTYGPYARKSVFYDLTSWLNETQPALIGQAKVAPGEVGTFTFTLYAPLKEGRYKESFRVAAEDTAWITGASFTVDVTVQKPKQAKASAGYRAVKLLVSDSQLALDTGEAREFKVGFKNIGKLPWKKDSALKVIAEAGDPLKFRHPNWQGDIVTKLLDDEVKPGQLAFFTIPLSAPQQQGTYAPTFSLAVEDSPIEGGEVEIPIEVRQNHLPPNIDTTIFPEFSAAGPRGPKIRVGLFTTTEPVVIAAPGAYKLVDADGNTVRELSGVTSTTYDFAAGTYTVRNGDYVFASPKHVEFFPVDPSSTIFEIQSFESRPVWDPSVNFNRFRGALSILYTKATSKLWVIEELPVEDYLRGLGETSNGSPQEFQRALVTAARSFALFVVAIGGKHQSEYFDVVTDGADQVYKGYTSELVRPNVVKAVEDTRGTVVSYDGDLVVTPYFSRSDGRTRSWTEVWGSKVHPWLVSKPAPYDAGKTLWGHGVGMSASDAVGRAAAGATWQDILKYYYTGIDLKQLY
jgi:hypothetical protein